MIEFDISLVWLRRDLRLRDQAALSRALESSKAVQVVFVFDTDILDALPSKRDRRVEFIHGSVMALKQALEALGATLRVLHGSATRRVPEFARAMNAQAVFCNRDYEPAAIRRDAAAAQALASGGIAFHACKDQVIFEQDELLSRAGKPFGVFTPYLPELAGVPDRFIHAP